MITEYVTPGGVERDDAAVTLTVTVVTGVGAVEVDFVIPAHEQALLYLAVPEQALAYVGTELGVTVT